MNAHGELLKTLSESPCFSCDYYSQCTHAMHEGFNKALRANVLLAQARLDGGISIAQLDAAALRISSEYRHATGGLCRKRLAESERTRPGHRPAAPLAPGMPAIAEGRSARAAIEQAG